jgi:hypothetical protein
MQKLFYLLFDGADVSGDKLREMLLASVVPTIHGSGASDLTVFANDDAVASGPFQVRRSDPPIRAMVSFWLEDAADREPAEEALRQHSQNLAGYLVLESRPMIYPRPIGERVEGMKQITCIARRAEVSVEEFHRIWHTDHREVAIETQSTFGYVRNEIFRSVTPGAPMMWAAFVEESFPIEALTDLKVFYNHVETDEELQVNSSRMMESCNRFLDPAPMEVTYVSEYYLG